MKIQIVLEYKDKTYESDIDELTDDEYNSLTGLIEQFSQGKGGYFRFDSGDKQHYFNKQILKQSIITIIKT